MTIWLSENKCTGCGACSNLCSVSAINMISDREGFLYPKIDDKLCLDCGLCKTVCPVINPVAKNITHGNPEVWACWSNNDELRITSTSGGIFTELASEIINNDGYICGAIYNEEFLVEHCVVKNKEGLEKLKQSKYIQSNTKNVFSEISNLLQAGKKVLFCGTPCQCAGLKAILNEDYENLFVVDFVCRGVNSPLVYRLFLDALEEKNSSGVSRVWFKNKVYGWRRFSTRIDFKNGSRYIEDRYSDIFIRGFIEANLYMRPSCSDCEFKGTDRVSDITLGDFWKITLNDSEADTDKGTSLVIINSDKGKGLFEKIKGRIFYERKTINDALAGNPCIDKSIKHNPLRKDFFDNIHNKDIIENISQYLKQC